MGGVDYQSLVNRIKDLETRVFDLENKLSKDSLTLQSPLTLKPYSVEDPNIGGEIFLQYADSAATNDNQTPLINHRAGIDLYGSRLRIFNSSTINPYLPYNSFEVDFATQNLLWVYDSGDGNTIIKVIYDYKTS